MKNWKTTIAGIISSLVALLALSGCGAAVQLTSATSADGKQWAYCVEVTEPILSTTASSMLCAMDSALLQQLQTQYTAQHPTATFGAVQKVPAK